MAIVRTYKCGDCGAQFEHFHASRDEPAPECPGCKALESQKVPSGFTIGGGNAAKAGDIAQDILEKEFGMSDIRDRQREGDIATITPPHLRPAVDNMWKAGGDVIAAAKAGAAAAAKEGRNPLGLMQKASKARNGTAHRVPISVVDRK